MPETSDPALPAPLGERFAVEAVYAGGEGWSGAVRDRHGATRMLKVLDPGETLTEASLLASLRHPRIPNVLETGATGDGRAWLLREHVAGAPLDELLPLGADAARELAQQLLEILAFVHLRGILHLDLKPANVVRRGGADAPEYCLLDFGLGARDARTSRGGTPFFAAPERLRGGAGDARSDLFSLGALLFAALRGTRELPLARFVRAFPRDDFFAAVGADPGALPAPFATLLPRLVARDPRERFADAQEALEALTGGGSGRPSLALLAPDPVVLYGDATPAGIAAHLAQALGLDEATARAAARHLHAAGCTTAEQLHAALVQLVEQARIVPDGTRWIWPDAAAGRLADARAPAPTASIRDDAARGRIERATAGYRIAANATPQREPALRSELVEGLLEGGEPARALPLTADLPLARARALLDLGRVGQAERAFEQCGDDSERARHLRACIAYARGDQAGALEQARALGESPAHRVLLGLALVARGEAEQAERVLADVAAALDRDGRPFLAAAALTNLAQAQRQRRDLAAARGSLQRALELHRGLGHARHVATDELNLGVLAKDLGALDDARAHLRRARSLYAHVGDRAGAALAEANLGVVSLEAGDPRSAQRRLAQARAELDALGARAARPLVLVLLARAQALLGEREDATRLLAEAGPLDHDERLRAEADTVLGLLDPPAMPNEPQPEPAESTSAGIPREVFRTFLAVNRRLATEPDLQRAMGSLLDAALALTGARAGYLLLERDGGVQVEVSSGQSTGSRALSRSLVNRAIQTGRLLTGEDALADRDLAEMRSVRDLEQRSALCAPFASASGARGALYVEHGSRAGMFDAAATEHLEALADQAAIAVDRLLHEEAIAAELQSSRRDLAVARRTSRPKRPMLGNSEPMRALRAQIDKVAAADLPVLIVGESGTGKELVARALHERSARHAGAFVAVNCSAIPEDLLESELFGHVKGTFTGADDDRTGLLELASGGTLLLDEIGDMPLAMQAKLLRALQEQVVRPVGGRTSVAIELRVLAATHKDLRALIGEGTFREDLFYRLAAVELRVPPLRERGGDILPLAEEFLARLNAQHRRNVELTDAARASLQGYPWPGNVRELEHVIARAFVLTDDDELGALHLPPVHEPLGDEQVWPVLSLQEAEARTIRAALESTGGDKTKAAKVLGISRTALYEKLKRIEKRQA